MANLGAGSGSAAVLLVVAAALVDVRGQVLVQQRPPGKHHGGLWEFPGGKVERGETPAQALVRELDEELAIAIDPAAAMPAGFASRDDGDRHLLLLLYLVRRWTGEPSMRDATALGWHLPARLGALPMPPADRALVATLTRLL